MEDPNQLNRRNFMKKSVALLAVSSLMGGTSCAQNMEKPNILLIISDDHGTDAVGCYGNPVIKTPNLDNLAKEGVRFTHAFCTTSSCSPSRSVILTGLHNHANGMYGLQHSYHHFSSLDNIKSLPNYLAEGGYRTARIGKFHLAPEHVYKFETVLSGGAANDMESIGRSPVEMANQCRNFINNQDKRPFFLLFALDDPHRGLPFKSWPDPNPFGNRPQGYPGVKTQNYDPGEVTVPSFLPDIPECRAELAEY
jgi:N-sulfoglucosamine sulfohydrolase